jgi:hypothetical protein
MAPAARRNRCVRAPEPMLRRSRTLLPPSGTGLPDAATVEAASRPSSVHRCPPHLNGGSGRSQLNDVLVGPGDRLSGNRRGSIASQFERRVRARRRRDRAAVAISEVGVGPADNAISKFGCATAPAHTRVVRRRRREPTTFDTRNSGAVARVARTAPLSARAARAGRASASPVGQHDDARRQRTTPAYDDGRPRKRA